MRRLFFLFAGLSVPAALTGYPISEWEGFYRGPDRVKVLVQHGL